MFGRTETNQEDLRFWFTKAFEAGKNNDIEKLEEILRDITVPVTRSCKEFRYDKQENRLPPVIFKHGEPKPHYNYQGWEDGKQCSDCGMYGSLW